jgi:hypothetical protein
VLFFAVVVGRDLAIRGSAVNVFGWGAQQRYHTAHALSADFVAVVFDLFAPRLGTVDAA